MTRCPDGLSKPVWRPCVSYADYRVEIRTGDLPAGVTFTNPRLDSKSALTAPEKFLKITLACLYIVTQGDDGAAIGHASAHGLAGSLDWAIAGL